MKNAKIFLSRHKFLNFIVCVICVWVLIACYDFYRVEFKNDRPACCYEIKNEDGSAHYIGAGYTFDTFTNPGTGQWEYAFYVFGNPVKTTFTN